MTQMQMILEGETKEDLATKVDEFLRRWINKHLKLAGHPVENFDDDIRDGEVYTVLLNNLDPKLCDKSPLDESSRKMRKSPW